MSAKQETARSPFATVCLRADERGARRSVSDGGHRSWSAHRAALAGALMLIAAGGRTLAQVCEPDALVPHAPTTVVYRAAPGAERAAIVEPSDNGTVYAVDAATRESLWSFTPAEVRTAPTHSGLLTDVRVLRFDANDDGVIDSAAGDKVWLYFGLRRAGAAYYALDITDRGRPRVLWKADASALNGLGDAWSTPAVARVRVGGVRQNGEHFVLIFGGGYAPSAGGGRASGGESSAAGEVAGGSHGSSVGNRILMLDAATGALLWAAGAEGADSTRAPNLVIDDMTDAIPAGVTVLDTNGDEFADRMYAVDVAGRIWRFDIWNGRSRDALVTGGMLADLGDASAASNTGGAATTRRFFNAPDVALIQPKGAAPYFNIAVGSGDVTATAASVVSDRFYAIRDYAPFDARSQAEYGRTEPILASELTETSAGVNATLLPPDTPGWVVDLGAMGRRGERVVAESTTVNGVVMFTTFERASSAGSCVVNGSTRVYAVRVETAEAGADLDGDGKITNRDLSAAVPDVTAPAAVKVRMGADVDRRMGGANGGAGGNSGSGGDPTPGANHDTGASRAPECSIGSVKLASCVSADTLLRTFWKRKGVR